MKTPKNTIAHDCARVCLLLLPKTGWAGLDLSLIAQQANHPLKSVQALISTKADIIPLIVDCMDEETQNLAGPQDSKTPIEDHLFDVLMCRFEALQQHRDGVLILAHECRKNPDLAIRMYRAQIQSMKRMLRWVISRKASVGVRIYPYILLALYNKTFLTWSKDQSTDLSQTMMAVNKIIRTTSILSAPNRKG